MVAGGAYPFPAPGLPAPQTQEAPHMADTPPTASAAPQIETVTLGEPIKRGEQLIEQLQLRKPKSGELRGLSLQDIMRADITALLQLIPRISSPPLTSVEADGLASEDLAEIGGVVRGFFMSASERKMMMAVIEEYAPKT
jgi:hypothetical protein